ncbi:MULTISPECIES: hypothetical protein [unclassified Imperialibacter]|uniref:hypothetical protein n=1 Tax=unclassified Imperialibacter TaxID=2629706 RepID=UPI00125C4CC7|nr:MULTISPECIES: hypothetical protein [unclassified Imperialibacter]CAD5253996.1 hypothetical protein IMPERIA89_190058 [Imperialibacter sp. 89]CAD5275063.1 hypothetical protein IMPERIA75_410009 [Imperialibacter sp. 75]VVT19414.1 hypothetical protein IMPR6_290009 [Imperialibacter sp. EC-SDR9]
MRTVALKVKDDIAAKLENLPEDKMRELEQRISEWLDPKQALLESMRRIREHAKAQGLTEEKLNELLNDK